MSSYYMKESTYRHDFGTTKQARDDMRIPITQNANYNQGPYTDRDRDYLYYQNGRNDDRPLYSDRPGYRGFERYDGLHTDRPRYDRFDDRNGPSDRRPDPYDNRGSDMYGGRGAMTDRGDYGRGRMEDRYEGPRETNRSPERYRYGERPANYEQADIYDKYGNNRTTQKDYGDFNQQRVRAPVDRPHAYRGKVDEEIDAFHNKAHKGNSRPDSLATLSTVDGPLIDELYLRPEEMKVRHRNMEYAYDQQQRLPLNIAPQRDYKHNIQRPDPTESGAYLFIRANKNNFHEIKTSFQKHKSVLHLSGVLKGIALNNKISVLDDFTNWNITQPIRKRGDVFYDQAPRNKGKEYSTDYMMVCLWFPSVEQARKWIDYDKDFQNAQFPDHNGVDMLIVPINYLPSNDVDHNTFVLTEYQDVVDKEGLNRYVREPIDDILRKDSNFKGCDPFVVWTEDVKQRRLIVSPRSFVSIHRFNSINQAMDYVTDERVERIKRELRGITRSGRQTTVIFQLGDFV